MTDLQNILTNPMMQRAGWALLHFLWQGAAVAVLLAGVMLLFRRRSSNLRYAIACSALLLMLAMPAATMWLVGPAAVEAPVPACPEPIIPDEVVEAPLPAEYPVEVAVEPVPVEFAPVPSAEPVESAAAAVESPQPWHKQAGEIVTPALPWIVLGWLIGVLALSAWHVRGWMQVQRLRRVGVRPVGREITEVLTRLCNRLGIGRAVRAVESALVCVPTVVGCLKPIILLPASALTGLTGEQLEAILAHELAHIRRHDYLVNLLQTAAETLLFYHPAAWWVSRRIRAERENCCDDLAVAASGQPLVYARALTAVAKLSQPQQRLAVAADGGGKFLARIRRIVGLPPGGLPTNDASRRGRWLAGAFTLLAVFAIVITLTLSCRKSITPATRAGDFADATVSLRMDLESGRSRHKLQPVLKVSDREQLQQLLAFFPQLEKKSNTVAGWKSGAVVELKKHDGSKVTVQVAGNDGLQTWNAGKGDWPVKGNLKAFLLQLKQSQASTQPATQPATHTGAAQAAQNGFPYKAFVGFRVERIKGGLVPTAVLAGSIQPDGRVATRLLPTDKLNHTDSPRAVEQGKLYVQGAVRSLILDLRSGEAREVKADDPEIAKRPAVDDARVRGGQEVLWTRDIRQVAVFQLVLRDVKTMARRILWDKVRYVDHPPSYSVGRQPPVIWLDDHRLMTVHHLMTINTTSTAGLAQPSENHVVLVDIRTKKVTELGAVPGGSLVILPPRGEDSDVGVITDPGIGYSDKSSATKVYAVSVSDALAGHGKLEQRPVRWGQFTLGGDLLPYGNGLVGVKSLTCGATRLAKRANVSVSPDGRRALWITYPDNPNIDGATLYYCDSGDKRVHEVAKAAHFKMPIWTSQAGITTPPATQPAEEWGKVEHGMRVRLRADKRVWNANETPVFEIDITVAKGWRLPIAQQLYLLRVDEQWYRHRLMPWGVPLTAGVIDQAIGNIPLLADKQWERRVRPGWSKEKLVWVPGKHTIQLLMLPWTADGRHLPISDRFRLVSNPVEVEILSTSASASQPAKAAASKRAPAALGLRETVEGTVATLLAVRPAAQREALRGLKTARVHADDTAALAATTPFEAEQNGRKETLLFQFTLVKFRGWWLISDVEFVSPKIAKDKMDMFLKDHPKAVEIPAATPATQPEKAAAEDNNAANRAVHKRLRLVMPRLQFSRMTLKEVLDFFRNFSNCPIHAKWLALEKAGITKDSKVDVHMTNVTLDKAIWAVLDDVAGPGKLGFIVDEGVIMISTQADLDRLTLTRVYDIRDLILLIPDAEPVSLGWPKRKPKSEAKDKEPAPTKAELAGMVIDLIQKTVAPDSWMPKGKIASMRLLGGQLIITQAPRHHKSIQDLFKQLREGGRLQILVKARFIQVSRDTDEQLAKWLEKQHPKATFKKGQWDIFLSEEQANAFIKEAKRSIDTTALTAQCVLLHNGQRVYIGTGSQKKIRLPLLDTPGKWFEVPYKTGSVLMAKATVSANRRYHTMTYNAEAAEISQQAGKFEISHARHAAVVHIPDGKTIVRRMSVHKYQPTGVRQVRDPDTGKTFSKVVEKVLPWQAQRYVYVLIKPNLVIPREIKPPMLKRDLRPKAGKPKTPATQPATKPSQ